MKRLTDQTLYEILEVPADAAQDALREAIERARSIFGPGSLAMYSLMSADEAELMNRRIEEADKTLLDPEARARYDATIAGNGATAQRVQPWSMPPVIPARAQAEEAPALADATAAAPPAPEPVASPEPVAAPPPEPAVPEVTAASPAPAPSAPEAPAAEPPSVPPAAPERPPAPILLLTRPVTPHPEASPPEVKPEVLRRAPIKLDRPVSLANAMTPVPQAVTAPPRAEEPMPAFAADAPWTGEMLRRVREARGIPIQIVAERTKVTRHHLENIEADRFSALPAPVYLRGILFGLARELRLDGQRVARSYLERMASALSPPPTTPGPKRG
ncbi:MAG: helix-turn-helix domain-containing protein [Anaeromyxobacter sp.]